MFEYRFQSGKRSKNGYRSVINSYYHTVELTDEFIEQYVKQYVDAMFDVYYPAGTKYEAMDFHATSRGHILFRPIYAKLDEIAERMEDLCDHLVYTAIEQLGGDILTDPKGCFGGWTRRNMIMDLAFQRPVKKMIYTAIKNHRKWKKVLQFAADTSRARIVDEKASLERLKKMAAKKGYKLVKS